MQTRTAVESPRPADEHIDIVKPIDEHGFSCYQSKSFENTCSPLLFHASKR